MGKVNVTTFILKVVKPKDTEELTSGWDRVQNHIARVALLTDGCI